MHLKPTAKLQAPHCIWIQQRNFRLHIASESNSETSGSTLHLKPTAKLQAPHCIWISWSIREVHAKGTPREQKYLYSKRYFKGNFVWISWAWIRAQHFLPEHLQWANAIKLEMSQCNKTISIHFLNTERNEFVAYCQI